MVADFVDQHMADDVAQRLFMLGPVIQDRPAVEPDHVGQAGDIVIAAEREADAVEQAEQVEFALGLHLVEHLVGRKIVDADDQALAQAAKALRQALEDLVRHGFHFGERGRFGCGPHDACLIAFSSEVEPGSRKENASNHELSSAGNAGAVDLGPAIGDRTARQRTSGERTMRIVRGALLGALAGFLLDSWPDPRHQPPPRRRRRLRVPACRWRQLPPPTFRRSAGARCGACRSMRRATSGSPMFIRATIRVPTRCAIAPRPMCRNTGQAAP